MTQPLALLVWHRRINRNLRGTSPGNLWMLLRVSLLSFSLMLNGFPFCQNIQTNTVHFSTELKQGELVKDAGFTLFEAVGALEVCIAPRKHYHTWCFAKNRSPILRPYNTRSWTRRWIVDISVPAKVTQKLSNTITTWCEYYSRRKSWDSWISWCAMRFVLFQTIWRQIKPCFCWPNRLGK